MEIKQAFLIWVGSEHYESIEDWTKEALEQGVSKRLPNEHMAKSLMDEGTVVFVAHDEGEHEDCAACTDEIECPSCRRLAVQIARDNELATHLAAERDKHAEGTAEHASLARRTRNANARVIEAEDEMSDCSVCDGTQKVSSGSGGKVSFEDGETWDYRQYNYWLHQPKKWTPEEKGGIVKITMCKCCGGTGLLPKGVVFGLFVPEKMDYIFAGDEEKAKELTEAGFDVVSTVMLSTEKKRRCGVRKAGGYYAVTKADSDSKAGSDAVKALGLKTTEVEVHGNFVKFLRPVAIPGVKRCRGLSRFKLPTKVAEEAEMIADAME